MGKRVYKKIGPVEVQEICVRCGEKPQISNSRGGYRSVCSACSKRGRSSKQNAMHQRTFLFKKKYGITLDEYDQMLLAQNSCCLLCGMAAEESVKGVLHVDHCHDTGKIRGLLCHHCNTGIGLLKHDPELLQKAIAYLSS